MLDGSLTGQFAVVTGAARGIGGAVVAAFAEAGAEVVALDREATAPFVTGTVLVVDGGWTAK